MIDTFLAELADYGVRTGLIEEADHTWAVNRLLEALHLTAFTQPETLPPAPRPWRIFSGTSGLGGKPTAASRAAWSAGTCWTRS